ncbi:MAG: recombination mediator RecR [Verrucomicrobium sp.]|nr:recombination mediator RecR [Verrucomicrobium sp.]
MPSVDYPAPIRELILQMKSLPGIGQRSAERLVLWMMGRGHARALELARSLGQLDARVAICPECGFFMDRDSACGLCADDKRQTSIMCVVEQAADVLRLERSGAFGGRYHVLGGRLSPLDNITPADLRITELLERVPQLGVEEVILALSADVEGEATSNYLADGLRPLGVKVTRLAQGMPAGGGLDHVDEMTLHHALSGRRVM